MFHTKDFLTLYLNKQFFFEKPPLYFWGECLSFAFWGRVTEFTARFPVALDGMLCCFTVYFLGKRIISRGYGVVSSLIFATSLEFLILGVAFTCPKCKAGNVVVKSKVAKCDREGCGLLVFRRFLNKELTDRHLEQLFSSGSTRLIKGFKGKKGCSYDAALTFDDSFNLKLSFPKPKGAKGK